MVGLADAEELFERLRANAGEPPLVIHNPKAPRTVQLQMIRALDVSGTSDVQGNVFVAVETTGGRIIALTVNVN